MALEETRKKLGHLYNKYDDELKLAARDIRPNWGVPGDAGNLYYNIRHDDVDVIYGSLSELSGTFSAENGPIKFDIEGNYIVENRALEHLRNFTTNLKRRITELQHVSD